MLGLARSRRTASGTARQIVAAEASEEALVARAQTDPAHFAAVYDRFFDQVFWYGYGRLRNQAAAEDAASLVFEKVLAALHRYDERAGPFRAWLFRIAHNVAVDAVRARRPSEPFETAAEVIDAAPTPEEAYLVSERRREVLDLLAALPVDQRRVIELRLAGLDGNEIGDVLGRSRSAVDSAQYRAVARLRTLVGMTSPSKETCRVER